MFIKEMARSFFAPASPGLSVGDPGTRWFLRPLLLRKWAKVLKEGRERTGETLASREKK